MQDRPTGAELLEAVAEFLERELSGAVGGALRYKALIAASAARMVAREMEQGEAHLREEAAELATLLGEPLSGDPATARADVVRLNDLLVARIRGGSFDAGVERGRLVALLRRITIRKLEISNPQFLEAARRRSPGSAAAGP